MTAPFAEFDDDGYPTEASLAAIASFEGSPREFVEFTTALYRNGFVKVEDIVDDFARPAKRITYITGGWSGCESVISCIEDATVFNMRFWASSHRGGMYVFEVRNDQWDETEFMGTIRLLAAADSDAHAGLLTAVEIDPNPLATAWMLGGEVMMEYLAALDSWHENYRREPRPPRPVNPHAPVIVK